MSFNVVLEHRTLRLAIRAALLATVVGAPAFAAELPNGVAAGDVSQGAAVLWARSEVVGNVTFELFSDAALTTPFGAPLVTGVTDPLQPVKADVAGLTAGTSYWYRAIDADGNESTGRFRTPAAAGTQAGLNFGVSGDWRGELAPYPAISNAPAQNLDFFVELGDTVYADYPSPAVPAPQATTLAEYRAKHEETMADRLGVNTWKDLRESTAVYATIDDHEVTNDFAGGAPISSDPRFSGNPTDLINDSTLFDTGLQAFQEYMPIQALSTGATGDPRTANEIDLYRSRTFGDDAAMVMLDARSFRDTELPGVANILDPFQVAAFLAASFDPTRTMLGDHQVERLKADLLAAQAGNVTWKFVMVPEPIQNLGPVGAQDRFEGYAAERTEILQFIDDNDISNVVFVAADIHGTVVNNLTYQTSPFGPQVAIPAWEITTGAVAFDAPFGPTVADIAAAAGLLSDAQKAFYDSLPIAPDADSLANDKDDFLKLLTNNVLGGFGYDPVGLEANLPIADGLIDAILLQGDYFATHTYGWTQFVIDELSQALTVTTYGIRPYTEQDLEGAQAILARMPFVVSQFVVQADLPERVPVPGTLALVGLGLAGLGWARRRSARAG